MTALQEFRQERDRETAAKSNFEDPGAFHDGKGVSISLASF